MSAEAIASVTAAVDVALRADAVLVAYMGGEHVFSQLESEDLPLDDYLVLANKDSGLPWRRFNGQKGERLGVTIHVWSRVQRLNGTRIEGDLRVLTMIARISTILVGSALPLGSYGLVAVGEVFTQAVALEPSGSRIKGVVRYEATCNRIPNP